jgi:hypothetical protein
MGMLFNTEGTLRLLVMLNDAFRRGKFTYIKNHPPSNHFIADLQALTTGANGIFSRCCEPLYLDDGQDSVSTNWKNFLNLLDTTNQGGQTISQIIGSSIAAALLGNAPYTNVKSIEFFAVPSAAGLSVQVQAIPFSNDETMIITVTTATVHALIEERRRSPSGRGRREE